MAISFLFIFLSADTAFGEILKLPVLVHHYMEHRNLNHESFYEFLKAHYSNRINHPDKHRDHEKLPFKAADSQLTQTISAIPHTFPSPTQIITETKDSKKSLQNQQNYSDAYFNNIWQPPRLS